MPGEQAFDFIRDIRKFRHCDPAETDKPYRKAEIDAYMNKWHCRMCHESGGVVEYMSFISRTSIKNAVMLINNIISSVRSAEKEPEVPDYYSFEEAASYLDISEEDMKQLFDMGRIKLAWSWNNKGQYFHKNDLSKLKEDLLAEQK